MSCEQKKLGDFGFDTDNRAYVIAEMGINHGGNIDTARRLVDSASVTGVDAVKFQTYLTEKRVSADSPIFDILKKCELSFKDFKELKEYTEQYDMEFFSTPFDKDSVDFLEDIGCNLYKVSSFDVTNQKLLSKIADTGKTVVMSVGMSTLDEIDRVVDIFRQKNCEFELMHCNSTYPMKDEDANLKCIGTLRNRYKCKVGYSGHESSLLKVSVAAATLGATSIERHITLDRAMYGSDQAASISAEVLKNFVESVRVVKKLMDYTNKIRCIIGTRLK